MKKLLLIVLVLIPLQTYATDHPLDSFSQKELQAVSDILAKAGKLTNSVSFGQVHLDPPPKQQVINWQSGTPFNRKARLHMRDGRAVVQALVDLNTKELITWEVMPGLIPATSGEEWEWVGDAIPSDSRFKAAITKRGIAKRENVYCSGQMPAFVQNKYKSRSIVHGYCGLDDGNLRYTDHRQIEGLVFILDLDTRELLEVVDYAEPPVPNVNADFDEEMINGVKTMAGPFRIKQKQGPGFTIDDNIVQWQNWRLHVRMDQRVGLVVSDVRYRDNDQWRRILYEGSLSEVYVPYMDPAFLWYSSAYVDLGEYQYGVTSLSKANDCPEYAVTMNAWVMTTNGTPRQIRDALCIFEREQGDVAWRHQEEDVVEVRGARNLVLRMVVNFSNYDYYFDWVFQQDGTILVEVKATGIVANKGVKAKSASDNNGDDKYGHFVDEHVVAVNHDHFFSFRLDFDVDGSENSIIIDRFKRVWHESDHRQSLWVPDPVIPNTETEARMRLSMTSPANFRIANFNRRNKNGYPVSYHIKARGNVIDLMDEEDFVRQRIGLSDYQFWATPYRPDERHAAGDYPSLSQPGEQGLLAWTVNNRAIKNTDIVIWYTLGMRHMVRAEDWPVMPVATSTLELRPFDFFDRNPALDLPKKIYNNAMSKRPDTS